MIELFGIPNCDSVKKVRRLLDDKQLSCRFFDFRKETLTEQTVSQMFDAAGQALLNRRGKAWRDVPQSVRDQVLADDNALKALLLSNPILIKRPVVFFPSGEITVGVPAAQTVIERL